MTLFALVPGAGGHAAYWALLVPELERRGRSGEFDASTHFLHDLSSRALAVLTAAGPPREPADTPFRQPCAFQRWPGIPIKVLAGADDRFFPAEFQRRVAKERLGIDADQIPGGHLVALSNPVGLADRLTSYAAELRNGGRGRG